MMDQFEIEKNNNIKSAKINNALGVFILSFGVVVLFAINHTENTADAITNLVAGLILVGIGGGMMIKARMTIRKNR
jgi:hypothetical protein